MSKSKLSAEQVIETCKNEQAWALRMWVSLIKSLLFVTAFTVATTYLFEGFWMWIVIGMVLAVVVPLYHLLKIQQEKKDFEELAELANVLPGELGNTMLKGLVQSVLNEDNSGHTVLPLDKEASAKITASLKQVGVIPASARIELQDSSDVIECLRKYASKHIVHFDTKCIEDNSAYATVFEKHLSVIKNKLLVTDISSSFDDENQQATLSFQHNGESIRWEFQQNSNWINDTFFSHLGKFVRENSNGEFLIFPAEDQCAELIFLPKNTAVLLQQYGVMAQI
ncbi:MAG TPA: hypothetical protein ENJ32_11125 [Crenotrichaceae bacterium]|nr:hypothetical protein [Crenotrichaceae bacterium]